MRSVMERQFLNRRAIHFYGSDSHSTQGSTVSDLPLNGDLSPASTLASSTIGSQHTSEKEGAKEGGRYNRAVRGYCNGKLHNGRIYLKRTLWFYNFCAKFNNKAYYFKRVGRDCFAKYIDSLVHHS